MNSGKTGVFKTEFGNSECRLVFVPASVPHGTWAAVPGTQGGCSGMLWWDDGDVTGHPVSSPGVSSLTADSSNSP